MKEQNNMNTATPRRWLLLVLFLCLDRLPTASGFSPTKGKRQICSHRVATRIAPAERKSEFVSTDANSYTNPSLSKTQQRLVSSSGSSPSISRSRFISSVFTTLATAAALTSTPLPASASATLSNDNSDAGATARSGSFNSAATTTISNNVVANSNTKNATKSQTTLQETISGSLAGAALATTKTIVKYPLDTATVRLQMPQSTYSVRRPLELLRGSFRGISTPLICNIPAGAVFFAVKDATKEYLKQSDATASLPKWGSTSLAVLAATFPYMLVRNPSEVVKTRLQAGMDGYGEGVSAWEAIQKVQQGTANVTQASSSALGNFYVGYWENVLYTYPADVLKFVAYEALSGGRKNVSPLEGAMYGGAATAMAQFLTTPLDVVRNRVMAATQDEDETNSAVSDTTNNNNNVHHKPSYVESLQKIAREEGLAGLFAGVSPRVGKAILSGAIQFATYEETKQSLASFFQSRQKGQP